MNTIEKLGHRLMIVLGALVGELLMLHLRLWGFRVQKKGVADKQERKELVIISLTSYGNRLRHYAPYTIYSLLSQTRQPDKVILWLDKHEWNEDNLPKAIRKLQKKGLIVNYTEDLKSYKKHVPVLETYPDAIVITVDDDFYYSRKMVERLMAAYEQDPTHIYTLRAHRPVLDEEGELKPYNDWQMMQHNTSDGPLFPTTGGGCLYKREYFHEDACKKELFQHLCPKADDVWFYFMGVLRHTKVTVLPSWLSMMIPLDTFHQLCHRGTSLQHENRYQSLNDKQIQAVMNHYHLTSKDLIW